MIKEEKSLMMLNVICKTSEIVATSSSKLLLIPNVEIGDDVKVEAASLFNQMKNPPGPHHCTILEAMELTPGTSVTVDVKVFEVCIILIFFLREHFVIILCLACICACVVFISYKHLLHH